MSKKTKGFMNMPVVGYGVATGINPDLAIFYKSLLDKPAICWGNVGSYPKAAKFNVLKEKIKDLCGFGWANTIESLYYYDGAHTFYRFPFHVQLFFKEHGKMVNGCTPPVAKTLHKYSITLYDPITRCALITKNGDLKNWNSKFDAKQIEEIGQIMRRFIDTTLNTKGMKDLLTEFKKTL